MATATPLIPLSYCPDAALIEVPVYNTTVAAWVATLKPREGTRFVSETLRVWADMNLLLVDMRAGERFPWPGGTFQAAMLMDGLALEVELTPEQPLDLYFQARHENVSAGCKIVHMHPPSIFLLGREEPLGEEIPEVTSPARVDLRKLLSELKDHPSVYFHWVASVVEQWNAGEEIHPPQDAVGAAFEEAWSTVLEHLTARINGTDEDAQLKAAEKALRRAHNQVIERMRASSSALQGHPLKTSPGAVLRCKRKS